MQCKKCGYQNVDGSDVCDACGAPLPQKSSQTGATPPVVICTPGDEIQNEVVREAVKSIEFLDDATLLNLAIAIHNGVGVEADRAGAKKAFTTLAMRGNPDGAFHLAQMLIAEYPPQLQSAKKWLQMAAERGHLSSKILLDHVFDETPSGKDTASKSASDATANTASDATANTASDAASDATANTASDAASDATANAKSDAPANAASEPSADSEDAFVKRVEEALPHVISIYVRRDKQPNLCATGFIVKGGYVVTNQHILEGEVIEIVAKFDTTVDNKAYRMKVVCARAEVDLAVLSFVGAKAESIRAAERSGQSTYFSLRTNEIRHGEAVYTIGSPLGLGLSIIQGVVSNPNLKIAQEGKTWDHVLQVSITSNHGNSGGPVLDKNNRVMGVIAFIPGIAVEGEQKKADGLHVGAGGVAMAVPVKYIDEILKSIGGNEA